MRRVTALGRTSAAVVAVGLVAVALTGCSSDPNADCSTALPSGPASQLVTATGKVGEKPKVELPSPIDAKTSQRTVLTEGSGERVHSGQLVELGYTQFDGDTGEVSASGYGASSVVLALDDAGTGFSGALSKGLQCTTVGSRVAVAVSPDDLGSQGGARPSAQIMVFDILGTSLSAANGVVRPSVSGFPTVVLAPTGQPGITIPSSGAAPTKVRSELLKAGDGATVKKDSILTLQYTAVGWDNRAVTSTSWSNGGPALASMANGQVQVNNNDGAILPESVRNELVGVKVGSQLVIETPADGSRPAEAWVVDILGSR